MPRTAVTGTAQSPRSRTLGCHSRHSSLEQEDQSLLEQESPLDESFFDLYLQIKRLLSNPAGQPPINLISSGIKLPKINVPNFDGDVLNWNSFWQQFNVAIHSKAQLNDAEKLAYRRDVLKDGPARYIVEGLTQDASYYKEAIGLSILLRLISSPLTKPGCLPSFLVRRFCLLW